MRYLTALLALFSTAAFAGQATVTWQNPVQYEDNTALAASDITQTRIEFGSCNGVAFGVKAGEVKTTGAATSVAVPNLAAGIYCFRAYTTAKGQESTASTVATKTVPQSAPKPPVLATIDTVAYSISLQTNKIVLARVGTVPLKLACVGGNTVNGFTVVPREKVKFGGTYRPLAVVAKCA